MKKFLAMILAVIMILMLLTACGEKPATPSTPATPDTPTAPQYDIKMSYQSSPLQCIPTMANLKTGIFDKYGISVQDVIPIYTGGAPQLEAQPGGEWDLALIGFTAAIRGALSYDMELIGTVAFDPSDTVYCREDSDIYKAGAGQIDGYPNIYGNADLWRGKTIIVTLGTTRDVCLQMVLATMGLTYDDVTILNMDNEAGRTAFLSGQGDLWVPTGDTGFKDSAADPTLKKIADITDVDMAMYTVLLADKEYAAANEDAVVSFLAAYIEGAIHCGEVADTATLVDWYQEVYMNEFGVEFTDEEAEICSSIPDFLTLERFEQIVAKEDNGYTQFQNLAAKFFDGHALVGLADPETKDAVLAACNTTYLEKAIALYKETNGIA